METPEERAVALVRRMAGNSSMGEPYEEDRVITYNSDHYCEARSIAAQMAVPDFKHTRIAEAKA